MEMVLGMRAYRQQLIASNIANADGNTVDINVERAKFAENALMVEFSLDRVSGHFKHLMELLTSLKD